MLQTEHFPTRHIAVTAVHRMSQEAEDGVKAHLPEKICVLDSLQQFDSLAGSQALDAGGAGEQFGAPRLGFAEPPRVQIALVLIVAGERAIDEPDHTRAIRA